VNVCAKATLSAALQGIGAHFVARGALSNARLEECDVRQLTI